MWTYIQPDELYHYGVKGMKWGVRTAQKKYEQATRTADRVHKRADRYTSRMDTIASNSREHYNAKKTLARKNHALRAEIDAVEARRLATESTNRYDANVQKRKLDLDYRKDVAKTSYEGKAQRTARKAERVRKRSDKYIASLEKRAAKKGTKSTLEDVETGKKITESYLKKLDAKKTRYQDLAALYA